MTNDKNLKIATGASKPPVGIVPLHPLLGMARVLEDSGVKYAPFNYMAQSIADACESYTSAELRHHIQSTLLGGQVTPESLATLDEDSGLPHIFHRITGLFILATLMIRDGVIPADPGIGKRKQKALGIKQNGHTVDGRPYTTNTAALDELLASDYTSQEHANGCRDLGCFGCEAAEDPEWCGPPKVHATPNGDGTYMVQVQTGIIGNVLVPGSIVRLNEQGYAELVASGVVEGELKNGESATIGGDMTAYDRARMQHAEREMAERAKTLTPPVAPMTNHHDPK